MRPTPGVVLPILGAGMGYGRKGASGSAPHPMSYGFTAGKGLEEPCSPYRAAYIFGAPFGQVPSARNWNCIPDGIDYLSTYNLSALTPNHEAVVVAPYFYDIPAGASYPVDIGWYRNRDNKLLVGHTHVIPNPQNLGYGHWAWYYIYSYIGYAQAEIWENGGYTVLVWHYSEIVWNEGFNITGITPQPEPEVSEFSVVGFEKR